MARLSPIKVAILLIVLLALGLRIVRIDHLPPALSADEISFGWNAYSILKTGYDEHQQWLPGDTLAAYGDYKAPLTAYLILPAIQLFGLNEFALRFPSALLGALSVFLVFLLVQKAVEIFDPADSPQSSPFPALLRTHLAWLTALCLALSPWHIQLSRTAAESNIAFFFILLGAYALLLARTRPVLYLLAWLPFVCATYASYPSGIIGLLLGALILILNAKTLRQSLPYLGLGLGLAVLVLLPLVPHLLSHDAQTRAQAASVFYDGSLYQTAYERKVADHLSISSRILHYKIIVYGREYLQHYFDAFQPRFLFVEGDANPLYSLKDVGQLYGLDLPFLLLGLYALLSQRAKLAWASLLWLLCALVPAGALRASPSAPALEYSLPAWLLLTAAGILYTLSLLKGRLRLLAALAVFAAYALCAVYFLHNYFFHYPREFSANWNYAYREAVQYAEAHKSGYDQIELADPAGGAGQAYVYALFYGKYDPHILWRNVEQQVDEDGYYHMLAFGSYRFVSSYETLKARRVMYILPPDQVPKTAHILETIPLLNGKPALVIFEER